MEKTSRTFNETLLEFFDVIGLMETTHSSLDSIIKWQVTSGEISKEESELIKEKIGSIDEMDYVALFSQTFQQYYSQDDLEEILLFMKSPIGTKFRESAIELIPKLNYITIRFINCLFSENC